MAAKKASGKEATRAAVDSSHVEVKSWTDLHEKLESMRDSGWIFRGVTSPEHYLTGVSKKRPDLALFSS